MGRVERFPQEKAWQPGNSQESKLPSEPAQFEVYEADETVSSMRDKALQCWNNRPDALLRDVSAQKPMAAKRHKIYMCPHNHCNAA